MPRSILKQLMMLTVMVELDQAPGILKMLSILPRICGTPLVPIRLSNLIFSMLVRLNFLQIRGLPLTDRLLLKIPMSPLMVMDDICFLH